MGKVKIRYSNRNNRKAEESRKHGASHCHVLITRES